MADNNIFEYDNLIGRPPGRYVSIASRFSEGIRSVQAQIPIYAAAWLAANSAELTLDKPLWVVLGDSMAQGIGASSYDKGWPGQLREKLLMAGRDYRMVNLSISGARVSDVLERQLPAMEALGIKPALVTMMIGSNNLPRKAYRLEAPAQFAQVLERLPAASVVASLPGNGAVQQALARQLRAEQGRLIIADMQSGSPRDWRGKLAADHFHPNDAGYAYLAGIFARALSV
jgi:lysophospholipase L1-like esterase